ncbi:hypothetical protein [Thermogemmatispora tikiterensis]|uniref:Uncharacterized protein n=1 Tax=Thermogemmatispora tikiterensis TaxID=1825093 RepID=A0A328VPG8_9CHLR|nr:hypothetical protein [Thermogemmatispora tikiterensis]RAQ97670.1 hypothetical protein A4R35_19180 [Thermogemmatispora tikiterensis]
MNLPPVGEGKGKAPYLVICYREEGGDMFLLPAACERCLRRVLEQLSAEPLFDPFTIVVEREGREILRFGARRMLRPLEGKAVETEPGEDGQGLYEPL